MFTEDDVNFVNEYMRAERRLHGATIFQFYLMEKLPKLPILRIDPDSRSLPVPVVGDADINDVFTLKAVGMDVIPSAKFEIISRWTVSDFVYRVTLSFEEAARHLSGFREFVVAAGFGRQRLVGKVPEKIPVELPVMSISELKNNDPIWGTW